MPRPRKIRPSVPGDAAAPADTEAAADALTAAAPDLDDGAAHAQADVPRAERVVSLTYAQLDQVVASAVAKALQARAAAQSAGPGEPPLPDQSQIDPTTITRPTLSKQGYVVPLRYGEPSSPHVKRL
jgi:hypothetical protein